MDVDLHHGSGLHGLGEFFGAPEGCAVIENTSGRDHEFGVPKWHFEDRLPVVKSQTD